MRYRTIDHTGDVGIKVYGKTLPELFSNAAYAFFDIMIKSLKRIEVKLEKEISLSANDSEQLLVQWLSEFLYLYETKGLIFKEFELRELREKGLEAVARGEIFDPKRHRIQTAIKAVTYHGLKIEKKGSLFQTLIIFDL